MSTPANVARGVEYLDARLPGWRTAINPDRLALEACDDCILGQLFTDYTVGQNVLGLSHREARALGFTVGPRQTWAGLTNAWRRVLAR